MALRSRYFAFLSYKPVDVVVSSVEDLHVPYYLVQHDLDDKETHVHVLILFDSLKSVQQCKSLVSDVAANGHVELVNSLLGYARYLCHLDNPEKHQYDISSVISGGGASDYSDLVVSSDKTRDSLKNVLLFVDQNGFISFSDLCLYAIKNDVELWQDIKSCPTNFLVSFMKSVGWTKEHGSRL